MNDESALIAAIITQPDEDTVRLAYADFLDERGGPGDAHFAAYIRCNVALARGDQVLHAAAREEIARNRWTWRDNPHSRRRQFPEFRFWVRRGFAEEVECETTEFLRRASDLIWHPSEDRPCPVTAAPIRKVRLRDAENGRVGDLVAACRRGIRNYRIAGLDIRVPKSEPVTCESVLSLRFPGVEFDLPTTFLAAYEAGARAAAEREQRIIDAITGSGWAPASTGN